MNFPTDLKYSDHDEWVRTEGDEAVIGITAFAQDALGELVFIDLPEVGTDLAAGDVLCEVESVKAVAEVYAAFGCQVLAVNEDLDGNEENVNNDPYGAGWLVRVKIVEGSGLDALMDADAYQAKIADA
jgi:glycine cleavage system H protein